MSETIRVIIADDHPLMRSGIRGTLSGERDLEIVGEAASGDEVRELCSRHAPDVLVMDLTMPGPPFVETIEAVKRARPDLRVLVLTAHDDAVFVRAVTKAGADGYLLKDEFSDALITAVRTVHQGGTWYSRSAFQKLHLPAPDRGDLAALSPRERDVARLVAAGHDTDEIADRLGVQSQTVRNYVSRIYDKLALRTRVELARWALEHGLGDG